MVLMKITLSPVASNKTTQVSVNGSIITVNGVAHDLNVIPAGGQAEAAEGSPFIGIVTTENVVIRYEYDSKKAEPVQPDNIEAYEFTNPTGEIPSPIIWRA